MSGSFGLPNSQAQEQAQARGLEKRRQKTRLVGGVLLPDRRGGGSGTFGMGGKAEEWLNSGEEQQQQRGLRH